MQSFQSVFCFGRLFQALPITLFAFQHAAPMAGCVLCSAAENRVSNDDSFKTLLQGENHEEEPNNNPHPDFYMSDGSDHTNSVLRNLMECICKYLEEQDAEAAAAVPDAMPSLSPTFQGSKLQNRGIGCGSVRKQVGALLPFSIVPADGAVESAGNSAAEADTVLDG